MLIRGAGAGAAAAAGIPALGAVKARYGLDQMCTACVQEMMHLYRVGVRARAAGRSGYTIGVRRENCWSELDSTRANSDNGLSKNVAPPPPVHANRDEGRG